MKLIYTLLFTLLFFSVGCQKKDLYGVVKDSSGNLLDGVEVKIVNSGFQTKTKKDGSFRLDYVPGNFSVFLKKEGFFPKEIRLAITEKTSYPMDVIALVPDILDDAEKEMERILKDSSIYSHLPEKMKKIFTTFSPEQKKEELRQLLNSLPPDFRPLDFSEKVKRLEAMILAEKSRIPKGSASKEAEATNNLSALLKGSSSFFNQELPELQGKKAFPCFDQGWVCSPSKKFCANGQPFFSPEKDAWNHSCWKSLGFLIESTHYFRYCVRSTGRDEKAVFDAVAIADFNCKGKFTIFSVQKTVAPSKEVITMPLQKRVSQSYEKEEDLLKD